MTLELVLFTILATLTAFSALMVVLSVSIVRSALFLLFTLIGVSFVYFLLGAEFLGATQLIVYVGGTLVLVVFGGMLTAGGPFQGLRTRTIEWAVSGAVGIAIFGLLVFVSLELGRSPAQEAATLPGPGVLGVSFLTTYLLPFEIVSVHLLVVLIGAAYLARAKKKNSTTSSS